ncbi:protein phosphatase 2C domain-containing protein [Haliangium ochraceum]|uniref:Cyclic nucleotide-binding protein n=1 Tax=Haliangium ochraceum (strain DSM 14365 / JCM 11303 / SMP-2) TaxID=502025 RepID=D0LUI6_HALO1|nr:protein phosphatase 2C domain-containing protein [Haliangium ochraceum]ACY19309.1 cyclic nucleotide-binding protein [Haliangium ochraceum DSM 14365]
MSTVIAGAATDVGRVREHNEDSHLVDPHNQIFIVADGMGGHAAGEVASSMAVRIARGAWTAPAMSMAMRAYAERGDPDSCRRLIQALRQGVVNAHLDIIEEARRDEDKAGMGTTFTGFMIAGGDAIFAHAGDSRAYLVRDDIAMQLSEDHTLLARLHASGVDPAVAESHSVRWRGVLTNALGIADGTRVATFIISLYSGDKILLCSDGVTEYVSEGEIAQVLGSAPSPNRAAQSLVDMANERGGADNSTAVVIKVVEAGETRVPPEQRQRDDAAVRRCALFNGLTPQERLRALRITTQRELKEGKSLAPVALGNRVAYVLLDGEVEIHDEIAGPGAIIYPEALIDGTDMPDRSNTALALSHVRLLTIRRDDFAELTEEESDLGVKLYATVAKLMAR